MASDVNNVKLGACTVNWGGSDIGLTKGGVEVEISTQKKKIMVDQYGETDVNEYVLGRQVTVRVPLAEQDLTTLASVIPGATLITDGTDETKKKVEVKSGNGVSMRDLAQELVLHPKHLPDTNKSEDFTVPLATAGGDMTFAYRHDEERIFAVEFYGYVDIENGDLLFVIGDTEASAA